MNEVIIIHQFNHIRQMKNQNNQATSSRPLLFNFGRSNTKRPSSKKQNNTPENCHATLNDSTNITIHDISQSLLGRTLRQFNQQTSLITEENLAYFEQRNNQVVSSRHGFVTCAKQLQLRGSVVKYHSYSIDEFNHILKYQDDNQFQAQLISYDRFHWEPDFRKALLNTIYNEMTNQNSIIITSLDEVFFDAIDKKIYLKKGVNAMKTFQVSSTLVQNVKAFPYKIDPIEQRKLKLFKMFSEQRIDELIEQYLNQYTKRLNTFQAYKNQNEKIKDLFYKGNKTDFKAKISQNSLTFENLNHLRRQNDLKLMAIKFHCRMIRSFYLNLNQYCRNLRLKPQFYLKDSYERLMKLKTMTNNFIPGEQIKEQKEQQKQEGQQQKRIQDLNEVEILDYKIHQWQKKLSQLEWRIISIAHFNTAIKQFEEQLFEHQVTQGQIKQLFRIEQKLQSTLMYIESSIVIQVRYIQTIDLLPTKYQQAIQLLIDRDELVNFIIHIDCIINQQLNQQQQFGYLGKSQNQILNLIKNSIPQLKLLLSSYASMTTSLLNQILEKYLFDFRKTYPRNIIQNEKISTSHCRKAFYNFQNKKKQTLLKWVSDLQKHMALYNFVMISYQFSLQAPFNKQYFCMKQEIQLPINYDTFRSHRWRNNHHSNICVKQSSQTASTNSKTLRKLSFFWRTFQKPQLLQRIYESSTLCQSQIKQIRNKNSFSFQTIFEHYIDRNEINNYKIKYYVHFTQYFLEIISNLSSSDNTSLSATFNSIRFLILNFVCFFYIQSTKRIEKEIKDKHGDLYYNAFQNQMKNSKRVANNQNKLIDAVKISRLETYKYLNELRKNYDKSGHNAQKLEKIFSDFPFIKQLFFELNIQEPAYEQDKIVLKDHTKAPQMEYNFDIARKCFLSILTLITKQFISKSVIQRIIKRLIPITQKQANMSKLSHQDTKQFLKKCNKNFQPMLKDKEKLQLFLNNKGYDSNKVYQTYFQKFILSFLEISKLSVMILSMPFYSYENELEYFRKRTFEKQSLKKRDLSKSKQKKILYNLDNFYINGREKISTETMQPLMVKFKLLQFFNNYINQVNQFFKFLSLQSIQEKMQKFRRQIDDPNIQNIEIRYPKYLHTQYLSIYSKLQLEQFFLSYNHIQLDKSIKSQHSKKNSYHENQVDDRHLRLQPAICQALNQFFKMCKAIEARAKNVMKEVIKKHQLSPSELNLGNIQENQNSDKKEDEKNDTTKKYINSSVKNAGNSCERQTKREYQ